MMGSDLAVFDSGRMLIIFAVLCRPQRLARISGEPANVWRKAASEEKGEVRWVAAVIDELFRDDFLRSLLMFRESPAMGVRRPSRSVCCARLT